jgi:hypothetical protein
MAVAETDRLASLVTLIPGLRAALLLDPPSPVPLARVVRDPGEDVVLVAARAARLVDAIRETAQQAREPAAAADVVVDAERSKLVLLHVAGGILCLVLEPGASPARAAFEARRALGKAG